MSDPQLERTRDPHAANPRHDRCESAPRSTTPETGSYPEAQNRTPRRRAAWVDNYVTRLLSRDADRISTLAHLDRLPQLLAVLAANTSGELVTARVAADVNLPETSLPPYLGLLESFGLIHTLKSWGRNLRQRVVGRPKVALLDTGVACRLAGLTASAMGTTEPNAARAGQLLETLVAAELRKQSTWSEQPFDLFHFRQRSGSEVDIVLETPDRRIAGIEVKASSTVDPRDFRGLHHLADMAGGIHPRRSPAHRQERTALRPEDVGPARVRPLAMTTRADPPPTPAASPLGYKLGHTVGYGRESGPGIAYPIAIPAPTRVVDPIPRPAPPGSLQRGR